MPRPCHCGKCRLCSLAENDPISRRIWGIDMDVPRERCRYLSTEPIDRLDCICPGKWIHSCEIYGNVTRIEQHDSAVRTCVSCPSHLPDNDILDRIPLVLKNNLCPGDVTVMTAAVESLHISHPNKYITYTETTAQEIWENNPYTVKPIPAVLEARECRTIEMKYPLVDQCNQRAVHFMQGFTDFLAKELAIDIPLVVNTPRIYISQKEKSWKSQIAEICGVNIPYWVINAGRKLDFTAKFWGFHNFQELINILKGKITFVQVGESNHDHKPLSGVIDLIGKTSIRQLIRLVYHSLGGVGPSTFLQHLCAGLDKPYILIAGGREPKSWQTYPKQEMFSTVGKLSCCKDKACWKSRTVSLGDKDKKDVSLCEAPILVDTEWVPTCLQMITPEVIANSILSYGA